MRIQETDRILKDARLARHGNAVAKGSSSSRIWITAIVALIAIVGGLFAYLLRESSE